MLELMHFSHEILEPEGLKPASAELGAEEIAMAKSLVDTMAGEWQPTKYQDVYQDAVRAMIDRKIKHLPAEGKRKVPTIGKDMPDILAMLQQSIAQGTDKRKQKVGSRVEAGARDQGTPRNHSGGIGQRRLMLLLRRRILAG